MWTFGRKFFHLTYFQEVYRPANSFASVSALFATA
jgi:hypothetical protein